LLDSIPKSLFAALFPFIDGFGRTLGATTLSFDVVLSHPLAAVRNSPFAMLFIATLTGAGGALFVPILGAFTSQWRLETPPWLVTLPTANVWGPTVSAAVYGALIDAHPAFRPLRSVLLALAGGLIENRDGPLLSPNEAKVVASLVHVAILAGATAYPSLKSLASTSTVNPPNGRPVGERREKGKGKKE
jgi:hypothetical protein